MPYTPEHALKIWDDFYKKTTQTRRALATFIPFPESKEAVSSDERRLVVVPPDDVELALFVRKERVKESTNVAVLNSLGRNIYDNKLTRADISNPELPYLAMALYTGRKISLQQCATLLEQSHTVPQFTLSDRFSILDSNNELTELARDFLSLYIEHNEYMVTPTLDGENERNFYQLVAALPPDQRVIYIYVVDEEEMRRNTLMTDLAVYGALILKGNLLCVPSTGIGDALGLTLFGADHYVGARPCLGEHSVQDIEAAINAGYRPGPYCFPDTKPFKENIIHGYEATNHVAHRHDVYHALIYSKIPLNIRQALFLLRERLKHYSGIKKSHEIWHFTDLEIIWLRMAEPALLAQAEENPAIATDIFCNILNSTESNEKPGDDRYYEDKAGYFIMKDKSLSLAGAIFFLSLILDYQKPADKNSWRNVIDPTYLSEPFKRYYEGILSAWPQINSKNPRLMIFKCQMYFALQAEGLAAEHINLLMRLIERHQRSLRITFDKVSPKECSVIKNRFKNTLCTVVFDRKLTNSKEFIWAKNQFLERCGLMSAWLSPSLLSLGLSWFSCCRAKPRSSGITQSITFVAKVGEATASARLFNKSTSSLSSTEQRLKAVEEAVAPLVL